MALITRPWDPPAVEEALCSLPGSVVAGQEVLLAEAPGHRSNCDVYVTAPAAWLPVTLILRARSALIRAPLMRKEIQLASLIDQPAGAGTQISALVISVRGHPCSGFDLSALTLAGVNVPEGIFRLEVWGEDGSESDQADPPAQNLFCEPHQHVDFTGVIAAGVTQALAANPSGGRVTVTHISLSSDNAAIRTVDLRERASLVVRWQAIVTLGAPIVVDLTRALRSPRAEAWDLVAGAGAGNIRANLYGFNE